jgi:hypothetical protein
MSNNEAVQYEIIFNNRRHNGSKDPRCISSRYLIFTRKASRCMNMYSITFNPLPPLSFEIKTFLGPTVLNAMLNEIFC